MLGGGGAFMLGGGLGGEGGSKARGVCSNAVCVGGLQGKGDSKAPSSKAATTRSSAVLSSPATSHYHTDCSASDADGVTDGGYKTAKHTATGLL